MKHSPNFKFIAFAGALALGGLATSAHAATVTWDATASANWNVATNWSSNPNLPAATDDVIMQSAAGGAKALVVDAAYTVNSFEMNNGNGNSFLLFNDGGSLAITGGAITKGTGNGGVQISQTNAAAAASTLTADLNIRFMEVWQGGGAAQFTTVSGQDIVINSSALTVGDSGGVSRNGVFTLATGSTLFTTQNVFLTGSGAGASSVFNMDGGTMALRNTGAGTGLQRTGDGLGTVGFNFNSGKISNDNPIAADTSPVIRSNTTNASTLDIALAETGTREFEVLDPFLSMTVESTARLVNATGEDGGFNKIGGGTLILQGENTYTGDTLVQEGTLQLDSTGSLAFVAGANGVNNQISDDSGTDGILTLDGTFELTLAGADTTAGNEWTLVDVSSLGTVTFDTNFAVNSDLGVFSQSSDVWTLINGGDTWTFTEADGVLSVIPEPSSVLLLGLGLSGLLALRRRRH